MKVYLLRSGIFKDMDGKPQAQTARVAIYAVDGLYVVEVGNIPLESDIVEYAQDNAEKLIRYGKKITDSAEIDAITGRAINVQVHPQCGDTETLGILRDQMVQWGNALGLGFTEDFTRLNKIANAGVSEGATKKAAITDA